MHENHSTVGNDLNMLPVYRLLRARIREIFLFALASALLAFAISLLLPKKYYAVAKLYPTNPQLADKGRLFSQSLEGLYSVYGTADDLDRLYTMANTDAMLYAIADSFNLINKQPSSQPSLQREKVLARLRKNLRIEKTPYGELLIGAWTKENILSAKIANAIVYRLNMIHRQMLFEMNKNALNALQEHDQNYSFADTTKPGESSNLRPLRELNIGLAAAPPPFIILDHAIPASKAGKPDKFLIVTSTFIAATLFASLFAIIFYRSKAGNGNL